MHHALETSFSDAYCSDECLVTQLRNIAHFKVLLEFCKKIYVSIYFLAKKKRNIPFFFLCMLGLAWFYSSIFESSINLKFKIQLLITILFAASRIFTFFSI